MNSLMTHAEVRAAVRLTRQEIHRRRRAGTFPRPIKIGSRRLAWVREEVEAWITERIAERDALTARKGSAK